MKMLEHIPQIVENITKNDITRHKKMLENLIEENFAMGMPKHGFLFAGEFHTLMDPTKVPVESKKHLHKDLIGEGTEYITEIHNWRKETKRISAGLSLIVQHCKTYQDLRDGLPDLLSKSLKQIQSLSRTREPGYMFQDQPLKMYDFKQTEELIGFYMANQLLY